MIGGTIIAIVGFLILWFAPSRDKMTIAVAYFLTITLRALRKTVHQIYVAKVATDNRKRLNILVLSSIVFTSGMLAGAALAAAAGRAPSPDQDGLFNTLTIVFFGIIVANVVKMGIIALYLEDSQDSTQDAATSRRGWSGKHSWCLGLCVAIVVMMNVTTGVCKGSFQPLLVGYFDVGQTVLAGITMGINIMTLVASVVSLWLTREERTGNLSSKTLLLYSLIFLTIGTMVFVTPKQSKAAVSIGQGLLLCGYYVGTSAANAFTSELFSVDMRGYAIMVVTSAATLALAYGTLLGADLVDKIRNKPSFMTAALPVALACVVLISRRSNGSGKL